MNTEIPKQCPHELPYDQCPSIACQTRWKMMNSEEVQFHLANIEVKPKVDLYDGQKCSLEGGRQIEVWRVRGEEGFCIRIFRPTDDGKLSKLMFGLQPDAARALMGCLARQMMSETDEQMAVRTVRVAGDATCQICQKPYRDHAMFEGHTIDDGTGRQVPWLRQGCDGELLKL